MGSEFLMGYYLLDKLIDKIVIFKTLSSVQNLIKIYIMFHDIRVSKNYDLA